MGRGGFNQKDVADKEFTWDEIVKHNIKTDRWIVVDGQIYDVTKWAKRHPGGEKIISGYAGEDASEAWYAFHNHRDLVAKYMKQLRIGRVKTEDDINIVPAQSPILADFQKLRKTAEDTGCFEVSSSFFLAVMAHILFFDLLGWFILHRFGSGWLPYITAAVSLTIAQAQAGWSQHDYGHLSVFNNNKLNHGVQIFIINFLKGASADWWNYRHFNHHAKPNVVRKDPDIRLDMFFLLGNILPIEWAKKKKGFMPYNHQHQYWYLIMPPLLLPLYFNYEIPYFLITRKRWSELFWYGTFFVRWQFMFYPILGFWGALGLFLFVRFLESHWFVWTTQMNHIPMEVNYDQREDWVTMQLKATCNVEPGWFNDWFTGHLNWQIEHHLFPTMPRHNYHKVAPLVKSLCKKHGLDYQNKSLFQAMKDIHLSLKSSGEMWYDAYQM